MARPQDRREFLAAASGALGATAIGGAAQAAAKPAGKAERFSFYLLGDTHYLANKERPGELDVVSKGLTSRLVDWLNRLPGSAIPASAGGGTVAAPRGVIHAGDVIDSGDRSGATFLAMQKTEWRCFEEDFGLTGKEGKLKWPVYEVHGNHDSPRGDGLAVEAIKRRNKRRPGLVNVSPNGLHYSWDWGPVHFVNLGIVVGSVADVKRRRRYAPLDSLPFLLGDLARHAKDRKRPLVLTHHVDVARYSDACDPKAAPRNPEWEPCDVRGYHDAIKEHNVIGAMHGHTHVRNVFRWDGTRSRKAKGGVPVFNTAKVSHFSSKTQAFLYAEVTDRELVVRELATKDGWLTVGWAPTVWRVPLR